MLKIEISKRHYNGDFGVGSIFEEKYAFEIEENLCISNSIKTFCNNEDFNDNILSKISASIPFILQENDMKKLDNMINNIKNDSNYLYNESHYKKDSFDFNRYNYVDITINGIDYEMSIKENKTILNELKKVLKIEKIDKILENTLNNIISMESDNNEQ